MQKSKSDHFVFYKNFISDIILPVVYVDDIVITGSDFKGILSLKSFLHNQFRTKDLEMLKYFLRQGNWEPKPCSTPIAPNVQLIKEGKLFEDPKRYIRLVGKLNYLAVTRSDIANSVSVLSPYMSSPTVSHWATVKRILCYLKEAPERGILYKKLRYTRIECFSDAD